MDPLLAIGQILVSIALIIAILLQARGVGLSGTFGGDSAVYRSRRGVERRLWQFTIVLLVLFVIFSPGRLHPRPRRHRLIGGRGGPPRRNTIRRSSMTRTDSFVVGTLVVMLALLAGLVGVPALSPAAATIADPSQSPAVDVATRPYREGVLGHPVSVSPLIGQDPGRPRPRRARLLRARPQRPGRDARARPRRALVGRPDRVSSGPSSCATTPCGTTASRSPRRTSRSRSGSSRTPPTTGRPPAPGTRSRSRRRRRGR